MKGKRRLAKNLEADNRKLSENNPRIHPKTKESHEESTQPIYRYHEKNQWALQQWSHLLSIDFGGTQYSCEQPSIT